MNDETRTHAESAADGLTVLLADLITILCLSGIAYGLWLVWAPLGYIVGGMLFAGLMGHFSRRARAAS